MSYTVDVIGDETLTNSIIDRTITEIHDSHCSLIGSSAFYYCSALTTADFPKVTTIGGSAFCNCYSLTTADFSNATSIGNYAFASCSALTTAVFPNVTSIGSNAFRYCSSLTTAVFPNATSISNNAFNGCYNLLSIYIGKEYSNIARLSHSNAFLSTPIAGYWNATYASSINGIYGSIYVPASLVDAYKQAPNWTYYSDRITAIPEGE